MDYKRFQLKRLREEQKLIHEASKLSILIGGIVLLLIVAWKLL